MNKKELINKIKNPIEDNDNLLKILNFYTQDEDLESSLLYQVDKEEYYIDDEVRNLFTIKKFNKWKDSILKIYSNIEGKNEISNFINKLSKFNPSNSKQIEKYMQKNFKKDKIKEIIKTYEDYDKNNEWEYISSSKLDCKPEIIEKKHRLSINMNASTQYAFATKFMDSCEKNNLPYLFKFEKDGLKTDSFIIYSDYENIDKYELIVNQIIENNENIKNNILEPSILTAKIDQYIGYGEEKDISQSTNIYEIATEIQKLNPDAEIRLADADKYSHAYEKIFSSIPGNKLVLPKGFYYSDKNGITNKHKTYNGFHIGLAVENLNKIDKKILLDKFPKINYDYNEVRIKLIKKSLDVFNDAYTKSAIKLSKNTNTKNKSNKVTYEEILTDLIYKDMVNSLNDKYSYEGKRILKKIFNSSKRRKINSKLIDNKLKEKAKENAKYIISEDFNLEKIDYKKLHFKEKGIELNLLNEDLKRIKRSQLACIFKRTDKNKELLKKGILANTAEYNISKEKFVISDTTYKSLMNNAHEEKQTKTESDNVENNNSNISNEIEKDVKNILKIETENLSKQVKQMQQEEKQKEQKNQNEEENQKEPDAKNEEKKQLVPVNNKENKLTPINKSVKKVQNTEENDSTPRPKNENESETEYLRYLEELYKDNPKNYKDFFKKDENNNTVLNLDNLSEKAFSTVKYIFMIHKDFYQFDNFDKDKKIAYMTDYWFIRENIDKINIAFQKVKDNNKNIHDKDILIELLKEFVIHKEYLKNKNKDNLSKYYEAIDKSITDKENLQEVSYVIEMLRDIEFVKTKEIEKEQNKQYEKASSNVSTIYNLTEDQIIQDEDYGKYRRPNDFNRTYRLKHDQIIQDDIGRQKVYKR